MIAIVDYGAGNLKSVKNALDALHAPWMIAVRPEQIARADGLILPGVGAFGDAAEQLCESGLREAIWEHISADRPFLGICVGMQLLFEHSEESPGATGLGVFEGTLRRFPGGRWKVPHIGWNSLERIQPDNRLFEGVRPGEYVYFVHSYYARTNEREASASCVYAEEFHCAVSRGNVNGLQFHPEKSGEPGLQILRNFCGLVEDAKRAGE